MDELANHKPTNHYSNNASHKGFIEEQNSGQEIKKKSALKSNLSPVETLLSHCP